MKKLILASTILLTSVCAHASIENLPFAAYVVKDSQGQVIAQKNSEKVLPVASLTKLMTAYVVLKDDTPLSEEITITRDDVDLLKNTRSRLSVGTVLTREKALELALVSSENRAAHALGRTTFNNITSFVAQMNKQARLLGMDQTHFVDPTGLSPLNQSTANDMAKLVAATEKMELVRRFSNTKEFSLQVNGRETTYRNSNILVKNGQVQGLTVSKTGFTSEAGRCIALKAQGKIGEDVILVGLGAGNSSDRTRAMRTVLHTKAGDVDTAPAAVKATVPQKAVKSDKKQAKKSLKKESSKKKKETNKKPSNKKESKKKDSKKKEPSKQSSR